VRTLSANVTAGLGGASVPCYLVQIKPTNKYYYYRYATATCNSTTWPTWEGVAFDWALAKDSFDEISRKIDITFGGNAQEGTSFDIRLPNTNLQSDTLYSELFIGASAEIRLIFLDKANPSWNNALPIFSGYVEDFDWDSKYFNFHVTDTSYCRHRQLPKRLINSTDHPYAVESLIGKAVPIIYGSFTNTLLHKEGIAYQDGTTDYGNPQDYAKCYLIREDSSTTSGNGRVLIAGHDLHSITDTDLRFLHYDDDFKKIGVSSLFVGSNTYSSGEYYSDDCANTDTNSNPPNSDYIGWLFLIPDFVSQTTTTTGENCVDEDGSNVTTIASTQTIRYRIPSGKLKLIEGNTVSIYIAGTVSGGTSSNLRFTFTKADESIIGTTKTANFAKSSTEWDGNTFKVIDITDWDFHTTTYNELRIDLSVTSADGTTFSIKNLYAFAYPKSQINLTEFYLALEGRELGEWIDSPNHSTIGSAGDLIENPALIAESIVCDELDQDTYMYGAAIELLGGGADPPKFTCAGDANLDIEGDITLEAWVYVGASFPATEQYIISKVDYATHAVNLYSLSLSADDGFPTFKRGAAVAESYSSVVGTGALTKSEWNHIVVTMDMTAAEEGDVCIYVNGVLTDTEHVVMADAPDDDGAGRNTVFWIGNIYDTDNTSFTGYLDDIRIWNRALTTNEIIPLYNHGYGCNDPATSGLVAWWNFDDATCTTYSPDVARTTLNPLVGPVQVPYLVTGGKNLSSVNDAYMNWVQTTYAKVPYRFSTVHEYDATANASTSFEVVAGERTSWKFAREILDRENSIDLLSQLAYEGCFGYFVNGSGQEDLGRIDPQATSTLLDITNCICTSSGDSSFSIMKTQIKDIKTSFILKYKKNYATDEYDKTLYVNTPDATAYSASYTNLTSDAETYWNKCSAAYVTFRVNNVWEYEAQWIRDDATAELFIKFMIDRLSRRAYLIEHETSLEALEWELLECVQWTRAFMPPIKDEENENYDGTVWRLIEQRVNPNTSRVKCTWLDVGTVALS
jgi:hypothetical protein